MSVKLRDFIYLDVERVKSLLAQLDKGLLTDRSDSSGSSKTVEGRAGVSIPLLADFGGTGQYVTSDQATETRTLHDFVYNYTEEKLIELGSIKRLPQDFSVDELRDDLRESLSPVEYILVEGRPYINDYRTMMNLMEKINAIQLAIARLTNSPKYIGASSKGARQRAIDAIEGSLRANLLDEQVIKDLTLVMGMFYRDRLVIKVLPFADDPDVRVVGPLHESMLRDPLEHMRLKFGTAPNDVWTVFGQVAYVPRKDDEPSTLEQYYSNEIEGALENMFDAMRGLEELLSVSYPEIAITPIAVYREWK